MVKILRETEKVDVIIALSHGGLVKGSDGRYTDGEDVQLARDVPDIDVVITRPCERAPMRSARGDFSSRRSSPSAFAAAGR
jgi:hypothetical protein